MKCIFKIHKKKIVYGYTHQFTHPVYKYIILACDINVYSYKKSQLYTSKFTNIWTMFYLSLKKMTDMRHIV